MYATGPFYCCLMPNSRRQTRLDKTVVSRLSRRCKLANISAKLLHLIGVIFCVSVNFFRRDHRPTMLAVGVLLIFLRRLTSLKNAEIRQSCDWKSSTGLLWAYYNCDSSTIQHPTRSYVLSSNNEHVNSFASL